MVADPAQAGARSGNADASIVAPAQAGAQLSNADASIVAPAQAGAQLSNADALRSPTWIPACAGMTRLAPARSLRMRDCNVSTALATRLRAIPTLRVGATGDAAGSRGGSPIAARLRLLLSDIRVT